MTTAGAEAVVEALAVATVARAREARLWKQVRLLRLAVLLLLSALVVASAGFAWQREALRRETRRAGGAEQRAAQYAEAATPVGAVRVIRRLHQRLALAEADADVLARSLGAEVNRFDRERAYTRWLERRLFPGEFGPSWRQRMALRPTFDELLGDAPAGPDVGLTRTRGVWLPDRFPVLPSQWQPVIECTEAECVERDFDGTKERTLWRAEESSPDATGQTVREDPPDQE